MAGAAILNCVRYSVPLTMLFVCKQTPVTTLMTSVYRISWFGQQQLVKIKVRATSAPFTPTTTDFKILSVMFVPIYPPDLYSLPPANEVWGKVIFSVACIKNSVHWGSASVHAGIPPPEQAPPCAVHAGRYGQQAGGMHPTGMQSCFVYFQG